MKKYKFKIVEHGTCTCEKEVHVEANSLEEAEELVYNDEYHIDYIELYNFDAEEVTSMESIE